MKHLPKITIEVIPHKRQRYPTVGDYFKKDGSLKFKISRMNSDYEFFVAIHELIEWYFCQRKGLDIKDIDKFDIEFEKKRPKGNDSEPGNSPEAPYYKEHQFATYIEHTLIQKAGRSWKKYDKFIDSL